MPARMYYKGTILNGFEIIEDLPSKNGKAQVKAICPYCKKEFIGYPKTLKNGDCKSCGCLKKQTSLKNLEKANLNRESTRLFYKGQTINNFYIIEDIKAPENTDKISWVKAVCPFCHYAFNTRMKDIKSGNTKSCGCIKSHGEQKISEIFNMNNIIYQKQYTPGVKYKKPLHFDFAVLNEQNEVLYCLEYDGKQHFENSLWSEDFELIKLRDEIKNKWCKENDIPLIRIPYWKLNTLTIEDLLLETSNFIIKE